MKSKNLAQLIAPALVMSALTLTGAAGAEDAPTVDSVLAKMIEATGGKEALEKVHSRVIQFTIESDTLASSQGEIFAAVPNKQRSHIELTGTGTIDEGFDGAVAWARTPWQPLRVKEGEELAKVKRDAEFHRDLKMKSIYPGLAYKGTEKVGDEDAYVLESKPTASSKEKFWISTKSGLPVRQESEFEGPQGVVNFNVLPRDYKTFDGLKYPGTMKMKFSSGGQDMEFTMKFVGVKHNVEVAAAKFAKPAE
jgi:outer membrane lipoprotein-sorting protein